MHDCIQSNFAVFGSPREIEALTQRFFTYDWLLRQRSKSSGFSAVKKCVQLLMLRPLQPNFFCPAPFFRLLLVTLGHAFKAFEQLARSSLIGCINLASQHRCLDVFHHSQLVFSLSNLSSDISLGQFNTLKTITSTPYQFEIFVRRPQLIFILYVSICLHISLISICN